MAIIFITKGKTNWKYILIIVILALIVAGESFLLLKQRINIPETKLPEKVEGDIEKYLHKDAILRGVEMPPEADYHAISTEEAILLTIQHLERKGVRNIQVRHLLWSVAPAGEFFIAGDCNFIKEDRQYSKFLAKINDGSTGEVGKPTLIFKGTGIWYTNLVYDEFRGEVIGNYEAIADIYNVSPVFKSNKVEDETADWKTYRNEEYGFEIKYPRSEEIHYEGKIEFMLQPLHVDFSSFLIIVWSNSEKLEIEDYFLKESACVQNKSICEYFVQGYSLKPIRIGKVEGFTTEVGKRTQFFAATQNNDYIIELLNRSLEETILNQMLSTFTLY